jgi:hypothetical protein
MSTTRRAIGDRARIGEERENPRRRSGDLHGFVASGINATPGAQGLELIEASLPSHLVRSGTMAGREVAVGEDQFGLIASGFELDAHQ